MGLLNSIFIPFIKINVIALSFGIPIFKRSQLANIENMGCVAIF